MAPSVELTASTFKRLQAHAVPLVDTIESVVTRMIDAYESRAVGQASPAKEVRVRTSGTTARSFNPNTPPNLTHSKVVAATYAGKKLEHGECNWNGLLNVAVRDAWDTAKSVAEFDKLMVANFVRGKKEDEGFRPLVGTGISVQGQDANGAWRAACHIAQGLGHDLTVQFVWREKDAAAFPGETGEMRVGPK